MTYTHKGILVTFNEQSCRFSASVSGKLVRKDSLPAMKRHIDKAIDNAFVPFTALDYEYHGPSLNEVLVTGIVNRPGRRDKAWEITGGRIRCLVVEKSTENIKLIRRWKKTNDQLNKLIATQEQQLQDIEHKIKKLTPP